MSTRAFINGKVFTSNKDMPYADSFVVENGTISWIGTNNEMTSGDYEIVDLKGRCVIPGLVDCHMHPIMLADFSKQISCLPPVVYSIKDMIDEISSRRIKQGPGKWILGWGYDEGKFNEKRSPNRYDLDKGAEDAPVCILRTCGHIRCVNSMVLKMAGIDRNTPDPEGGHIDRDENGEPTGVLRENARFLVTPFMPEATEDEIVNELADLGKLLLSQGIVAICDMGNLTRINAYEYYSNAVEKGFLQEVGIYYMWDLYSDGPNIDFSPEMTDRSKQIRNAGIKLIGDGSVSGHTAWMMNPYKGTTDDYGISVCSDDLMESAISYSKANHCQLSIHAMGGRTIKRFIDRISREENWMHNDIPFVRMEHLTEPLQESLEKAAEKGIAFATQPIFFYAEIESYMVNLNAELLDSIYPVRTMLDNKVKVAMSTDAPATSWAVPSDPFPNIKAAVTRTAYEGTNCGSSQIIDVESAIMLYTKESAEVAGFSKLGQLKPGYKADFAVLSDNIFEIANDHIDKVYVEYTYVKGERVYEKEKSDEK